MLLVVNANLLAQTYTSAQFWYADVCVCVARKGLLHLKKRVWVISVVGFEFLAKN
jgi:hypothetical protein